MGKFSRSFVPVVVCAALFGPALPTPALAQVDVQAVSAPQKCAAVPAGFGREAGDLWRMLCREKNKLMRSSMWRVLSEDPATREQAVLDFFGPEGDFLWIRGLEREEAQRAAEFIQITLASYPEDVYPNVTAAARQAKGRSATFQIQFMKSGFASALATDRRNSKVIADHAAELAQADRDFVKRVADTARTPFLGSAARNAVAGDDAAIAAFLDGGWSVASQQDLTYQQGLLTNVASRLMAQRQQLVRVAEMAQTASDRLSGDERRKAIKVAIDAWGEVASQSETAQAELAGLGADARATFEWWDGIVAAMPQGRPVWTQINTESAGISGSLADQLESTTAVGGSWAERTAEAKSIQAELAALLKRETAFNVHAADGVQSKGNH